MTNEQPKSPEKERNHEQAASEVIEALRGKGYFREHEDCKVVMPGESDKWVARCDADSLHTNDPEWKKLFPKDMLAEGLKEAGYKVDVWPDYAQATENTFRVEYYLYEKKDA